MTNFAVLLTPVKEKFSKKILRQGVSKLLFFGINIVRLLFLSLSFIKFSLSVFFFAQIKTTNVVSSNLVP